MVRNGYGQPRTCKKPIEASNKQTRELTNKNTARTQARAASTQNAQTNKKEASKRKRQAATQTSKFTVRCKMQQQAALGLALTPLLVCFSCAALPACICTMLSRAKANTMPARGKRYARSKEQEACKRVRGLVLTFSSPSEAFSALAPWLVQNGLNSRQASHQASSSEKPKVERSHRQKHRQPQPQEATDNSCKILEALLTFSVFASRKDGPASAHKVTKEQGANRAKRGKKEKALITTFVLACEMVGQASRQDARNKREAIAKSPEALLTFLSLACRVDSQATRQE
jgi:hypothetical protein